MKNFAIGLLSAAAVATTILLVRQQKDGELKLPRFVPGGDSESATLRLGRIREAGL